MGLDKTGLDSRIFDALSVTSRKRYVYACNMQTGVSRWSQHIVDDFDMPGEYFMNADELWGRLLHPEDREKYFEDIRAIFNGEKDDHVLDYRVLDKNGNYVYSKIEDEYKYTYKGKNIDSVDSSILDYDVNKEIDSVKRLVREIWR